MAGSIERVGALKYVGTAAAAFVLVSLGGCGGDLGDDYLHSGDTLSIGTKKTVVAPIAFSVSTCPYAPGKDCTAGMTYAVLLPAEVEYEGGAEFVANSGDYIFGENDVKSPRVYPCSDGGTLYRYELPEQEVGDHEDEGLAEELVGALLDGLAEEFRFKIRGRMPSSTLGISVLQTNGLYSDEELCGSLHSSAPFLTFKVS